MHKLLAAALLMPVCFFAQSFTASVRGIVTDSSKAAVPGAKVTLTEADRGIDHPTTSDAEGRYILPSLPPGRYTLKAEAQGFRSHAQPAFALEIQQAATIDIELTVGDVTSTIQVEGEAPLINTTIATLGQVVDNKFLVSTPIASRNPLALTALVPGIIPVTPGGVTSTNFVANGTRNSSADVLLDGMNIAGLEQNGGVTQVKYTPSVDVVEEFKVQTNFFSAEFGNTGGSIINAVSKSGTNEIHGVAYEFVQNSAMNANSWFSNRNGQSLPDSKRNLFGATMGGPLTIPKLYNGKNRTFFFMDYEGQLSNSATTSLGSVPTLKQRAGDFSDTRLANGNLATIYNPYDTFTNAAGQIRRRPFAGNIIPDGMQNPISKNIVKYYPTPTSEGNPFTRVNNFFAQGADSNSSHQFDVKVDHNISEKQRLSTRYSYKINDSTPFNITGNESDNRNLNTGRAQSFVLDYTRTQSPTTIITARLGILRNHNDTLPRSIGFDQTTLGFSSILQATGAKMFPSISASGYRGMGAGGYALINQNEDVGTFSGSVTKIIGGQTLKFGGEGRFLRENYYQPNLPQGGFSFNRAQTGENPLSSSSSQGDAIASLLLGWGSSGTLTQDYRAATASQYFGMYLQDDWRITSKLTINLGLRYDFDVPRTERFDRLNWFDPYTASPLAGKVPGYNLLGVMNFVGNGNGRSPFFGDYNNIQPRVGIAYALNSKTSIRTGYGIFYTVNRASIKGEVGPTFRADSAVQFSRDRNITQFATLQNPFPVGLTNPPGRNSLAFLGLGFDAPVGTSLNQQYQQWNFSIQRQVPGNGVVEINYAGSKGTHLYVGTSDIMGNYNKLDPRYYSMGRDALGEQVDNPFFGVITDPRSILSSPTVTLDQLLRPYPQYAGSVGGYLAPPNIGNSTYHSLQLKYEKRFSRGLSVITHYTFSKMLTDSDVNGGSDVDWLGGGNTLQNWQNFRLEKSLSAFDIPHRLVFTADYQLPIGRGRAIGTNMNKVVNAFVGGWEFSTIMTFSKGFPIAISSANGNLWDADQRPNLLGDPSQPGSAKDRMNNYFNTAAFSQPDDDVLGTAPRTLNYRAPGVVNADVTGMKNFNFTERRFLQLRLESFNITNTPTFGAPNASFGGSSFGVISGYAGGRSARTIQAAVKFYY